MGRRERIPRKEYSTRSPLKRDHSGSRVGQAGTASSTTDAEGASSGVIICILSANPVQASHLQGTYPCTGEETLSMGTDTKKDRHTGVEIHYNMAHHEQRLVEGG